MPQVLQHQARQSSPLQVQHCMNLCSIRKGTLLIADCTFWEQNKQESAEVCTSQRKVLMRLSGWERHSSSVFVPRLALLRLSAVSHFPADSAS